MVVVATGSVLICASVFPVHEMERERIIAINAVFIDAGPAKYDRISSMILSYFIKIFIIAIKRFLFSLDL